MGRIHSSDARCEHEGHTVGYVPRDWVPAGITVAIGSARSVAALECYGARGVLRELGTLEPDQTHDIHGVCVIGYACACGWRSPYRELGTPIEWSPCVVNVPEWLEDSLARTWWEAHVLDAVRSTPAQSASSPVELALKLSVEDARALLAFVSSRDNTDVAGSASAGLSTLGFELEQLLRDRPAVNTPASNNHQPAPERERPAAPQLHVVARSAPSRDASVSLEAASRDQGTGRVVAEIRTDEAAIAARLVGELEQQRRKQVATRERWGEDAPERMQHLCRAFPSLRGVPGTRPWDAMQLLAWLCTSGAVTTGSRHAAKFVLQVWNSSTHWGELALQPLASEGLGLTGIQLEPFNAVQALAVWDSEHENAFRVWCELPFWP